MCGIAGFIGKNNQEQTIKLMVKAMAHRGPDGDGVFCSDGIALGHARLSILDLSDSGAQPMYSDDGNLVMVFNGEVFNYKELAKKLLPGVALKSSSDSEVVLKLYEKMGPDALAHFRGMFAILIWDKQKQELFGARDRLGIKPLYYFDKEANLLFGSEIKTLLASGLVEKKINQHALVQLFQYGHIAQPNSIIQDVQAVPPATYFKIKINEPISFQSYWHFQDHGRFQGSFEEACEQFRNEFETAVDLRMISDRPIGVFLSSGLDSVSLLAALKNSNRSNVDTYTIGFEDTHKKFYREDIKAKEISTHFGYKNESVIIQPKNIIDDFPGFVFGLDQPSIDGFNSYLVSKYTSQHITVALSGLGGDELFLGYPRNIYFYFKQKQGNSIINSLNEKYHHLIQNGQLRANKYILGGFNKYAGFNDVKFGFWIHHLLDNYSSNLQKFNFKHTLSPQQECDNYLGQARSNNNEPVFNQISEFEFRTYTMNQLLRDMDTVSMYNSMEVRVPFLDHRFVEFCLSLPDAYKFNSQTKQKKYGTGTTTYTQSGMKYILGKSYEHLLPPNYLDTPKQGFQLPVYDWAFAYAKKVNYDIFSKRIVKEFFNERFINEKRQFLSTENKFDTELFLLFILALWADEINY
jgi:asparagine synthase (glutamine-hydrolysing)